MVGGRPPLSMLLASAAIVAAAVGFSVPMAHSAPDGSAWIAKANAVCNRWSQRAAKTVGLNLSLPSSPSQRFALLVRIRRIEVRELAELRALPSPPARAVKALDYAATDVSELERALADYRADKFANFKRHSEAWWDDERASIAFDVAGAPACAS